MSPPNHDEPWPLPIASRPGERETSFPRRSAARLASITDRGCRPRPNSRVSRQFGKSFRLAPGPNVRNESFDGDGAFFRLVSEATAFVNFGGNTNVVTTKATIAGDAMNGTMSIGQFGSFPINAKKNQ